MSVFNCGCKCNCTLLAVITSVFVGIITAFLQITNVITVGTAFLWVVLGVSVVYLAVLLVATALYRGEEGCDCLCSVISVVLAGILGSALFSVILLAVGIVAASVISAILVGLLLVFFSLTLTSTACLVKCLADCGD